MKYEIITNNDQSFMLHTYIHLFSVVELYNRNVLSGQDVWNSIRLFYPKCKIENFNVSKEFDSILDRISDIETLRENTMDGYSKALNRIRSFLKKRISELQMQEYDEFGNFNWKIKVTDGFSKRE